MKASRHSTEFERREGPKIEPITETGSGNVQQRERALLREIIERVNDLFQGNLTDLTNSFTSTPLLTASCSNHRFFNSRLLTTRRNSLRLAR